MSYDDVPRRYWMDRMGDPRQFLVQSWVVSVAILGVLVVLLIAVLSMF